MRDNKVQSVLRAIDLLKIIGSHPAGIGVAELARQAGLHKSTVSRLVTTLEAAGAVFRASNRGEITIAPDFANHFLQIESPHTLISVIRPLLEGLSARLGEAVGLALPEEAVAVYVDQVSPDSVVQVRNWTGSSFPLHTVSAGKLFLAFQNETKTNSYLSQPLSAFTQNTVTDPTAIKKSLAKIRKNGLAWIYDEFADGLSAVAAPIFNQNKEIIAAISVYGPSYRFPNENNFEEISRLTIQYAEMATQKLNELLPT